MEQIISICIAICTGIVAYRKQNKRVRAIEEDRDKYKNQVNRYYQVANLAVQEAKKQKDNIYNSELWQVDTRELIGELLKRTFDDGQPKVMAQCVTNNYNEKILVGLLLNEKYKVG